MITDILTKPLTPKLFKAFSAILGLDKRPNGSDR